MLYRKAVTQTCNPTRKDERLQEDSGKSGESVEALIFVALLTEVD